MRERDLSPWYMWTEIPMKRHGGTVPFSRKLEIRFARPEMSCQRYGRASDRLLTRVMRRSVILIK